MWKCTLLVTDCSHTAVVRNMKSSGLAAVAIHTTCFHIQKLRILPTQCIYVFRMILSKTHDQLFLWKYSVYSVSYELNLYIQRRLILAFT
jgi:hypothetical protein